MRKINKETRNKILRKTPWGHSAKPAEEGLTEEQIKGMFYKAITDSEDSVISEINRIVEEGNKQFSEIDNTEYFGTLENEPLFEDAQKWVRSGNLVYVYSKIEEMETYRFNSMQSLITNFWNKKSILLRVTAPEGVIPDNALKLEIGGNVYNGLSLLKNSVEEASNGIYRLRFAVPVSSERNQDVTIKWNAESREETIVFDFKEEYTSNVDKKLFIKYASNSSGGTMTTGVTTNTRYIGYYYGFEDVPASGYTWVRYGIPLFWVTTRVSVNGWTSNKECSISVSWVTIGSILIVQPVYDSYDTWYENKVRVKSYGDAKIIFICDTVPEKAIGVNIYIGSDKFS